MPASWDCLRRCSLPNAVAVAAVPLPMLLACFLFAASCLAMLLYWITTCSDVTILMKNEQSPEWLGVARTCCWPSHFECGSGPAPATPAPALRLALFMAAAHRRISLPDLHPPLKRSCAPYPHPQVCAVGSQWDALAHGCKLGRANSACFFHRIHFQMNARTS